MHYVNYLKHQVYPSDTDHRRHDLDLATLPEEEESPVYRTWTAVLPLIALYRPAGTVIAVGSGVCRAVSHVRLAILHEGKGEWGVLAGDLVQTMLVVVALATTLFHFGLGTLVTTGADVAQGTHRILQYACHGEYSKAFEEFLQTLASSFYLTFLLTGSLEVILIATVVQIAVGLYQARNELADRRYVEAAVKLILVGVRGKQAYDYRTLIVKRNAYLAMAKYQRLIHQVLKGRDARHLIHHQLADLEGKIDEKRVTLASCEQEYDFGSHFHGLGQGLVKGMNLTFCRVVVDGQEKIECDFKVNHAFRKMIEESIQELQKHSAKETREIFRLFGSHASGIHVEGQGTDDLFSLLFGEGELPFRQITISSLGEIRIGASPDIPTQYDRVTLRMNPDKTLFDLHELMALTNLDAALLSSSPDDLERLKLGHLFRNFFPKEATPFERESGFFSLSTRDLLEKMIEKAPKMRDVYDKYFDRMEEAEILPGRIRYRIRGFADEVYALGGRYLTAAITGAWQDQELYQRAASMLSMGMLSHETRDNFHVDADGLSGGFDYFMGGSDSVFLQMLTKNNVLPEGAIDPSFLSYFSKVRVLISLKALEMGSYQYFDDSFGVRRYGDDGWFSSGEYANRPTIFELTQELQGGQQWQYDDHEIMLKERIDPSYFEGFLVDCQETKLGLLDALRARGFVQRGATEQETILGKPIDEFIRVEASADAEALFG